MLPVKVSCVSIILGNFMEILHFLPKVNIFSPIRPTTHCSSDQQEQTSMVWPCHEERRRVNAEGCNEVKDEGKETERKTNIKVPR